MEKHLHSFSWNYHRETFFKTVFDLKKQEAFCDVTLACEGVLFPVHRLVLAMCSEFFNEILTKFPCQQPMIMLIPGVDATNMEYLLKYIYQGEIQVSQASLPSLLKAAHTLKIKGLCGTSKRKRLEQHTRQTRSKTAEATTATTTERAVDTSTLEEEEEEENISCDSMISVPPPPPPPPPSSQPSADSLQNTLMQNSEHFTQLTNDPDMFPQVEVFINKGQDCEDLTYEGETKDDDEPRKNYWFEDEDEKSLDPLNVPLLSPLPLTFDSPDSESNDEKTTSLLEMDQNSIDGGEKPAASATAAAAAGTTSPASPAIPANANYRYTREQKLQIVQNYYIQGPCKTAKLMSELLGRKMNESSVRSIVKSWERRQTRVFQ